MVVLRGWAFYHERGIHFVPSVTVLHDSTLVTGIIKEDSPFCQTRVYYLNDNKKSDRADQSRGREFGICSNQRLGARQQLAEGDLTPDTVHICEKVVLRRVQIVEQNERQHRLSGHRPDEPPRNARSGTDAGSTVRRNDHAAWLRSTVLSSVCIAALCYAMQPVLLNH